MKLDIKKKVKSFAKACYFLLKKIKIFKIAYKKNHAIIILNNIYLKT